MLKNFMNQDNNIFENINVVSELENIVNLKSRNSLNFPIFRIFENEAVLKSLRLRSPI